MWTAEKYGYKLTVDYESCPSSPRDWDHESQMICWHRRYNIGDSHDYKSPDNLVWTLVDELCTCDELIEYLKSGKCDVARLVESSDNPDCWTLQCRSADKIAWYDAEDLDEVQMYNGRLQWAMEDILFAGSIMELLENLGKIVYLPVYLLDHSGLAVSTSDFGDRWDSGQIGWIYELRGDDFNAQRQRMKAEVAYYDDYLRGECYDYSLEKDGEVVDSCGDFLGDWDNVLDNIRDQLDLPRELCDIVDELKEV